MMFEILKELHIIDYPKHRWLYRLLGMINVYPENVTFATQNKDEEVVIILRKHIINNIPWIITAIFLTILPFFLYWIFSIYDHNLNNDALLQGAIIQGIDQAYIWTLLIFYFSIVVSFAYFKFIHWYFDIFIITNERYISIDFDILRGRTITDIPLTDIIDISEKVFGFFPTIFGYGNIEFKTTSEKFSVVENVPQTVWIRDSLSDLIRYIRKIKVVKSKENIKPTLVVNGKEVLNENDDKNSNSEIGGDDKEVGDAQADINPMDPSLITDIVGDVMAQKEKKKGAQLIKQAKEP